MEKVRKVFQPREIMELIVVILGVSFILTFPNLEFNFFITLVVVAVSMFLRHFSHKLMADRLGCMATFKLWITGTVIGIVSLLLKVTFGFIFLALGYVEIVPYKFGRMGIKLIRMTTRDYGHIALAGVAVNLSLMLIFGVLYTVHTDVEIFQTISKVNGLLAFFSLLPIMPLEGSHIFTWSIWFWVILMIFNILSLIVVLV